MKAAGKPSFTSGPRRPPRCATRTRSGFVAVLGSTFDESYEPVKETCEALDRLAAGGGPDVPVHVDSASGGFIAPFV
jgi:glutamate decarboxylase